MCFCFFTTHLFGLGVHEISGYISYDYEDSLLTKVMTVVILTMGVMMVVILTMFRMIVFVN